MDLLHLSYALVGVLAVLLAFWSSAIRRARVSEPMLALVLGALAGPVLELIDLRHQAASGLMLEASRILLAVSLMAVALRFPLSDYRSVTPGPGPVRPVSLAPRYPMPGVGGW